MKLLRSVTALIRLGLLLALLGFAVSLSIGNPQPVTLTLPPLPNTATLPAYGLTIGMFVIGAFVGVISCVLFYNRKLWQLHSQTRKLSRENEALRKEQTSSDVEAYGRDQLKARLNESS